MTPILIAGTVLWTTYSGTEALLGDTSLRSSTASAALAGGVAGGAQALIAAPAENLRLVLEGNRPHSRWSSAWKEVFRGSNPSPNRAEAREFRRWMDEVKSMAGRGWNGWGWGCAKDVAGENSCSS